MGTGWATALEPLEWSDSDWADMQARRRLDREIARSLGWQARPEQDFRWFTDQGEFSGYFAYGNLARESVREPIFAPTDDAEAAILAAQKTALIVRLPFNLHYSPNVRDWRASFMLNAHGDSVAASHVNLCRAVCEAIFQVRSAVSLTRPVSD